MTRFDDYPKSIKKALRYIKQEASLKQLNEIETTLIRSIKNRKETLKKGELAK